MAWTTPRTWTDGELVTAAIMNPHVRDNLSVVTRNIVKTADESVASSTVLQDDNHLFFAMAANEYYAVQGLLWHEAANDTPDFKFGITVPAGADYHTQAWFFDPTSGAAGFSFQRSIADTINSFSTSTGASTYFVGTVVNAGTAGNFQVQWAQNTSNATATVMKKGSYLLVSKLG